MDRKAILSLGLLIVVATTLILAPVATATPAKVMLGAKLYFDASLSEPAGQACADCHQPFAGYADPEQGQPVSEGVILGRFGGRNAPSAAYMGKSPVLHQDADGVWIGGAFWDGRASGWTDKLPLIEQAKGPFKNPGEMNNPSEWEVVRDVKRSSYAWLFKAVYGWNAFANTDKAYHNVADAIAAFESSSLVNTYSSRFDAYDRGARWVFTKKEKAGLALFTGEKAKCSQCHTIPAEGRAVFTDFSYDNLGLPANPRVAALVPDYEPDPGLAGFLSGTKYADQAAAVMGAFKVPTLRNVGKTAPYGHNGYFDTLQDIVHFYNTRDVDPTWAKPEFPVTMNRDELGNLGLLPEEESAIVAFLKTLDDRAEFQPWWLR